MPNLADVVISNVPGAQAPLYAAGVRMETYWPLNIVQHRQALSITAISYAGAMGLRLHHGARPYRMPASYRPRFSQR